MNKKVVTGLALSILASGCDIRMDATQVMKCPIPGPEGRVQVIKLEDEKLYTRLGDWKPHPGRYLDGSWISEFATEVWKRTAIWDFKYLTYTQEYRPTSSDGLLSPSQLKTNGTYSCIEIE